MSEYNFRKTESWILQSKTFNVEVKHWYTTGRVDDKLVYHSDKLSHRWNVYVYVFPNHPFFEKLVENQNNNHPFLEELHYGCTYCDWSRAEDGSVKVKKYGSDYMHLHDEHFEDCDSEKHPAAREIFFDAERLFDSYKESESVTTEPPK